MTSVDSPAEPALGSDSPTETAPVEDDETPWPAGGFEQRRAIDAVRGKLFGRTVKVHIGRYRIDRRLGAGGMGEVYLGFDEALDRKVAIKRVRTELDSARHHARLRDEARALARLSHTNVVQIYEVGEHEGQTFLAMEFVEGTTLTGWLEQPHDWRAILDVFLAAGRGLAAAHSAGVVHRDFKPDNVLIGGEGRVCVADFGLALVGKLAPNEIAGTIRYMSLEQLRGSEVDARTDQFAFCTALYEALWERAPFDRSQAIRRVLELESDQPAIPPRGLPRALWPVIRRGIRRDPDQRWPSFTALLGELEAIPIRRRRRAWAAALTPVLLATVAVVATLDGDPPDACLGVATELDAIWNDEIETELADAFAATGVGHAAASAERVASGLDGWTAAWIVEREAQCRAADHDELAQSRRACLERQRRRVEVLTTVLRDADVVATDRAVEAIANLPEPSACSAVELLEGPEPATGPNAEAVESMRLELAELRSLRELGHTDLERGRTLVEQARALDHPPVLAEALADLGRSELAAGDPRVGLERLDEAARAAITSNHPRLLAETWTLSAMHRLTDYPDLARGEQLLGLAAAAWARVGPDDDARSLLDFAAGRLARAQGQREQAIEHHRAAIERFGDRSDVALPGLLVGLAEVSEPDEALDLRERALVEAERAFGSAHPETALYLYNLGAALLEAGEFDAALPRLERATQIWTQTHGDPHPDLARAHVLLAGQALETGDLERAEAHAKAVASIHAASLPPDHPDLGDAPMLLGRIAGLRGDRVQALVHSREALRVWERSAGPLAPHVLAMRLDIAGNELGLGNFAAAEAEYRAVVRSTDAPEHEGLAWLGLAEIALRQGRLDEAREHLQEAEAIGVERLDNQQIAYAVLNFLTESREGCSRCGEHVASRIAELMVEFGWTREVLAPWLVELRVTPAEATQLGLSL